MFKKGDLIRVIKDPNLPNDDMVLILARIGDLGIITKLNDEHYMGNHVAFMFRACKKYGFSEEEIELVQKR